VRLIRYPPLPRESAAEAEEHEREPSVVEGRVERVQRCHWRCGVEAEALRVGGCFNTFLLGAIRLDFRLGLGVTLPFIYTFRLFLCRGRGGKNAVSHSVSINRKVSESRHQ